MKDIYTAKENSYALMFKLELQFSVIFYTHFMNLLCFKQMHFLGPLGVIVPAFKVFSMPVAFNTSSFSTRLYQ